MSLFNTIQEDLKQAMRDKDSETLGVLRLLHAALKNKVIELKRDIEDADVVAAVRSDVKKMKEALKDFESAAREDLIEQTKREIEILKKYLPAELSDDELESRVKAALEAEGIDSAADIGRAMGAVMKDLAGQADGTRVREMVQKLLK
jgi:hypothetical protein